MMQPPNPQMSVEVRRGSYRHQISLQCTLCQYQFRSPKILPCYHSFCEACLYDVVARHGVKTPTGTRVFACPICRAKAEIQKGGVHTLQTNYVLAAQVIRLNMQSRQPECSVCCTKRKPTEPPVMATLKCWECNRFLCNKCLDVHRSLLKFHTLIQVSQAGPVKVIRNTYCGKHPDEFLRFYCLRCEDSICRDCRMTSHAEGHRTVDMADLQQSAKDLVSKVNELIVENFVPVLDANSRFFGKEFEEKKKAQQELANAIKEREKTLMKIVQDAAKEALDHLDGVVDRMEEESKRYHDNLSRMRSETEFNELVLESGCEADVMQAAINVMPYSSDRSPQACLVSIVSQKQDLVWDRVDVLPFAQFHAARSRGSGESGEGGAKGARAGANKDAPARGDGPQGQQGQGQSQAPPPPEQTPPFNFTLRDWRDYADAYLGRVNLHRNKLTLNLNQVNEASSLAKCFRKIGMLVDLYKRNYKNIAK